MHFLCEDIRTLGVIIIMILQRKKNFRIVLTLQMKNRVKLKIISQIVLVQN